jgi:hypothetical protein
MGFRSLVAAKLRNFSKLKKRKCGTCLKTLMVGDSKPFPHGSAFIRTDFSEKAFKLFVSHG